MEPLRTRLGKGYRALFDAVGRDLAETPRRGSLVEVRNSRLRGHFTLRRHRSNSYINLLRFFLNHWRFMRSRLADVPARALGN